MSVWTTRTLDRTREYIVLQHTLKGVNYVVGGVRFRDGYAVLERDSKTYHMLKRIPVLRNAREFPITHLRNLSFITRTLDVKNVFGHDVYIRFLAAEEALKQSVEDSKRLEQEQKEQQYNQLREEQLKAKEEGDLEAVEQIQETLSEAPKCSHRTADGTLCKLEALEYSPSGYCAMHIIDDPRLEEFGLKKPDFMTKKEKRDFRDKVKSTLEKAKKSGKF